MLSITDQEYILYNCWCLTRIFGNEHTYCEEQRDRKDFIVWKYYNISIIIDLELKSRKYTFLILTIAHKKLITNTKINKEMIYEIEMKYSISPKMKSRSMGFP